MPFRDVGTPRSTPKLRGELTFLGVVRAETGQSLTPPKPGATPREAERDWDTPNPKRDPNFGRESPESLQLRGDTGVRGSHRGPPTPPRAPGGQTHTRNPNQNGNTASPNQEAPGSLNALLPVSLLPARTSRDYPVPTSLHPQGTPRTPRHGPPGAHGNARPRFAAAGTPGVPGSAGATAGTERRLAWSRCPQPGIPVFPMFRYLRSSPAAPPPRPLPPFDGNRRPRARPFSSGHAPAGLHPANASAAPPRDRPPAPN